MPDVNQKTKNQVINIRGFERLSLRFGGKRRPLTGVASRNSGGTPGLSRNLTNGDPDSVMLWGEDG